jgi:hypothetical protein
VLPSFKSALSELTFSYSTPTQHTQRGVVSGGGGFSSSSVAGGAENGHVRVLESRHASIHSENINIETISLEKIENFLL